MKWSSFAPPLTAPNIEEAAKVVGIGPKTLRNWQMLPEFQDAYRKANDEIVDQTMARLQRHADAALTVMVNLMTDTTVSAAIKLKAATYILDGWMRAFETRGIEDLEVRLRELERAAEDAKTGGKN
jgi:hypothetical protein